jgi:hypothetical protein
MEEFNAEVIRKVIDEVIFSIRNFMNGVNMNLLESIIGIFHRKLIKNDLYVRWVVLKLFTYETLTTSKFSKLLETSKWTISPKDVLGYYRHELQYELDANRSIIARKINSLRLEQENLNKFIEDFNINSDKYEGSKLANVLDKPELFRYIQDFLRI